MKYQLKWIPNKIQDHPKVEEISKKVDSKSNWGNAATLSQNIRQLSDICHVQLLLGRIFGRLFTLSFSLSLPHRRLRVHVRELHPHRLHLLRLGPSRVLDTSLSGPSKLWYPLLSGEQFDMRLTPLVRCGVLPTATLRLTVSCSFFCEIFPCVAVKRSPWGELQFSPRPSLSCQVEPCLFPSSQRALHTWNALLRRKQRTQPCLQLTNQPDMPCSLSGCWSPPSEPNLL